MSEEEFQRKIKWTGIFCIIVGILFVISFILSILGGNIINTISSLVYITLLVLFYALSKSKKIAGPILGIILGSLYILQFTIVGIVIGILIIVDCAAMIKYISNLSKQSN